MDPHLVLVSEHEEDRAITLVQEAGSRGTKKKVLRMEGVRVQFIVFWFSPSRDVLLRRKKKKEKEKKEKKRKKDKGSQYAIHKMLEGTLSTSQPEWKDQPLVLSQIGW